MTILEINSFFMVFEIAVELFIVLLPIFVLLGFIFLLLNIMGTTFDVLGHRNMAIICWGLLGELKKPEQLEMTKKNFIEVMGQKEGLDNDFCLGCKRKIEKGQLCLSCINDIEQYMCLS